MRLLGVMVAMLSFGCGDDGGSAPDMAVVLDLTVQDLVVLAPECDVFGNSGCPTGEKCTVGTQNGTPRDLCFAVSDNPKMVGAECSFVGDGSGRFGDDCAPGLICLDFPGDGPHCRRPCYQRGDCAGGDACVFTTPTGTVRQTEGGMFALRACAQDSGCDPVAQTVCTGGRKCWLAPADDVGRAGVCLVNRMAGMAGAECMAQVDCAAGFRCAGQGFCRRYCYFTMPDGGAAPGQGDCPAAEGVCDRFSYSGPLYGICGAQ